MDSTLIHPESYELTEKLLISEGFSCNDVGTKKLRNYFNESMKSKLIKQNGGNDENLEQIIEALQMDPCLGMNWFYARQYQQSN